MTKQYAERDAMALDEAGGYYMRHVMAMTGEQLHGKGDIAAELGWRDMQIAALQQKLDAVVAENVALRKAHPQPFGPEMMKAIDAYIAKEDEVPEQGMMDAFFILRDSITLKSSQVDAILNEVRAEAVGSLWIDSLRDVGRVLSEIGAYHDASEAGGIVHDEIKERVENFAAQLRAGSKEGGV